MVLDLLPHLPRTLLGSCADSDAVLSVLLDLTHVVATQDGNAFLLGDHHFVHEVEAEEGGHH